LLLCQTQVKILFLNEIDKRFVNERHEFADFGDWTKRAPRVSKDWRANAAEDNRDWIVEAAKVQTILSLTFGT